MSFSEHEKVAEQGPQLGLPLVSHVETDFACSRWFAVVSLFPGFLM